MADLKLLILVIRKISKMSMKEADIDEDKY